MLSQVQTVFSVTSLLGFVLPFVLILISISNHSWSENCSWICMHLSFNPRFNASFTSLITASNSVMFILLKSLLFCNDIASLAIILFHFNTQNWTVEMLFASYQKKLLSLTWSYANSFYLIHNVFHYSIYLSAYFIFPVNVFGHFRITAFREWPLLILRTILT